MGDPFIGEIAIFAGNYPPYGWAFCDGRLLPITQNQALFSIIGTKYGGDGRTTFALPDLRGRSGLGMGAGPGLSLRAIGQTSGQEKTNLGLNELAAHNHTAQSTAGGSITGQLKCITDAGDKADPTGAYIASHTNAFKSSGASMGTLGSATVSINSKTSALATTTENTGGNIPHENMHPFLVLNYIIALQGIYPSRE